MQNWIVTLLGLYLATAPAADAHATPKLPRVVGGGKAANALRDILQTRSLEVRAELARRAAPHAASRTQPRQSTTTCGPGIGSCAAGLCCSAAGFCGVGSDYCAAPDCQISYGPACDGNIVPPGASTASIARPKLGSVPYGGNQNLGGGAIQDCTVDGVYALTFDDGPYIYTEDLLNLLDTYNGSRVTFMVTGNNLGKSPIDDCSAPWYPLLQRMHASGHQIGSHTWSHQNFTALTPDQFQNQIIYNEMAFRNILGFFPTYLRPPFSECNNTCSSILKTWGYHSTFFDTDTDDYDQDSPDLIQNSKNNVMDAVQQYGTDPSESNFLIIAHDIQYQTVYNLTAFIIEYMQQQGFGLPVTVGQCLGDPEENWYRSAGSPEPSGCAVYPTSSTAPTTTTSQPPPTGSLTVSTDGTCANGNTCLGSVFGNCCSQAGWCGSTSDYCGDGCQTSYGECGAAGESSSVAPTTTTTSSASPTGSLTVSTDGTCANGNTCLGSIFGNCCSQAGWCGSTSDYCGDGCQAFYGDCGSSSTTTSAAPPTGSLTVSTDGTCANGNTCLGSTFGNCCSQHGFCGSTSDYCGDGCQAFYGDCDGSSASSTTTTTTKTTTTTTKATTTTTKAATTTTKATTTTTKAATTTTTTKATATTTTKATTSLTCTANNCLRNLQDARYSSSASAFCSTYTTTVNAATSAIPTYLGNCHGSPSSVSSACSCLLATKPTAA